MRLPVAVLIACVSAVAACSTVSHPSGVAVCGTHLNTGAYLPAKTTLPAPGRDQVRPAPAKSVLPGPATGPTSNVVYLAPADCDSGAVVTVDPATVAGLVGAAYARDGGVAALVLTTSGKVTVRAWRGGAMTGIITLPPA